jgi:FAD binding domain in molybdopterin dehydrogenase
MKPRAFEYVGPMNLPDALHALATREDAKVLSGGQSLVPAMNFRLASRTAIGSRPPETGCASGCLRATPRWSRSRSTTRSVL